jgi:hypothetical protein
MPFTSVPAALILRIQSTAFKPAYGKSSPMKLPPTSGIQTTPICTQIA